MSNALISAEADELAKQVRAIENRAPSKAQVSQPPPSNTVPSQATPRKSPAAAQPGHQGQVIHSEPSHIPGLTARY